MAGMKTSAEQGSQRQHLVPGAQVDWMIHMYAGRRGGTLITEKAQTTLAQYGCASELGVGAKLEIEDFMRHAQRQIDQIRRRVILGETILHEEKVLSNFEPHTEWISKGKAGVPVELGVKVCILEDQHQFILHHQVMEKTTDDQVAVPMVVQAKKRFPKLNACSFDKGFHSSSNLIALKEHIELVALPRKGQAVTVGAGGGART